MPSNDLELLVSLLSLALTFIATIATICIPILLGRLASSQNRRLHELQQLQLRALEDQRMIHQHQRRDALLEEIGELTEPVRLTLAWKEINDFGADDQRALRAAVRSNPHANLPGSSHGPIADDVLDADAVTAYIDGMPSRYLEEKRYSTFDGFTGFVANIEKGALLDKNIGRLVRVLTGPSAEVQRPSHQFFRDLVNDTRQFAPPLLYAVEKISYEHGDLRLNVLTGTLLAVVDSIEKRSARFTPDLRDHIRNALAWLLHRDVIRSFDYWKLDGSTEPVSATVAWLIRVTGWAINGDTHIDMRIVENLQYPIRSIPQQDRRWGVDEDDVAQGFAEIERKAPVLWQQHGKDLTQAADEIGSWRPGRKSA
jgi:hypothetical protein